MLNKLLDDVFALIAQCLLVKEILQLCRIDHYRHAINQSPSWAVTAWRYSYLEIGREQPFAFWLILEKHCVNDRIPISIWQPATRVLSYVLPRWISRSLNTEEHWDDNIVAFSQKLLDMIDQPASEWITIGGASYEVLVNLTYSEFHQWSNSVSNYHLYQARFILAATPCLQSLYMDWDYYEKTKDLPNPDDIFAFIPRLTSLVFTQEDSDHTEAEMSILPIRRTLECLPQLKHVAFRELWLSIQDMIDIAAHPCLEVIRLESCGDDFAFNTAIDVDEINGWPDQFCYFSPDACKFEFPCLEHDRRYPGPHDEGVPDDTSEDESNAHGDSQLMTPYLAPLSDTSADAQDKTEETTIINFIKTSLALPTTSASLRARLPLVQKLRATLKSCDCSTRHVQLLCYQLDLIYEAIHKEYADLKLLE